MTTHSASSVSGSRVATAAALTFTLGLAGLAWVIALWLMRGMDMGVATQLGPFGSFVILWVVMMAAMMLPAAPPAVLRNLRSKGRLGAVPAFVASYLAVWALVGIAIYLLYRPHGVAAAAVLVIAAGAYELTPFKRSCRRLCQESALSGFEFGLHCVGSSIGLMAMLIALGTMSVPWMALIALLVVVQKLLPPRPLIDIPLALVIVGFGLLIAIAPSRVPGLMPPM